MKDFQKPYEKSFLQPLFGLIIVEVKKPVDKMLPMDKILIVDDNSDIRWVVETVLKRYGFEVMALPRGEDVIPKAKSFSPQLILLDVFLSGIDGIEVCNRLKQNTKTKDIPVIMFSAHTNFTDIKKFCKADDFIAKPFDVNELVSKIQYQIKESAA